MKTIKIVLPFVSALAAFVISGCAHSPSKSQPSARVSSNIPPPCKLRNPPSKAFIGKPEQATPVVAIAPQYPLGALLHGLEGIVYLRFTISPAGNPCDAGIVYSDPGGIFVPSALRALANSTFKPKLVDGKPVPSRAKFAYEFHLPDKYVRRRATAEPISMSPVPAYPASAYLRGIEGFVTLSFTVDTEGHPHNPVVVDSKPKGVFDSSAIRALMDSNFKIKNVDGQSVSYRATYTYKFRVTNKN